MSDYEISSKQQLEAANIVRRSWPVDIPIVYKKEPDQITLKITRQ